MGGASLLYPCRSCHHGGGYEALWLSDMRVISGGDTRLYTTVYESRGMIKVKYNKGKDDDIDGINSITITAEAVKSMPGTMRVVMIEHTPPMPVHKAFADIDIDIHDSNSISFPKPLVHDNNLGTRRGGQNVDDVPGYERITGNELRFL